MTPNIVRPSAGLVSGAGGTGWAAMPLTACAALPSTWREIRFRPATSVTEYSMAMSLGPT